MSFGDFEAARNVGGVAALVAFIAAAASRFLKARLAERRKLIESAPESERGALIESALRDFGVVQSTGLTREQRFELIRRLIDQRLSTYKLVALVLVIGAVVLATVAIYLNALTDKFDLTLRVRPPLESAERIVDLNGVARLEVGHETHEARVVAGMARFDGLTAAATKESLRARVELDGFSPFDVDRLTIPGNHVLEVFLPVPKLRMCGRVTRGAETPIAVPGATVAVGESTATTGIDGSFCLEVAEREGAVKSVSVMENGVVLRQSSETLSPRNFLTLSIEN